MSINKPNLRGGKGGALKGALSYGVYFATAGLVRARRITREQYERTLREGEKLRAYLEAHSREVAGQVEWAFHALKEAAYGEK